MSNIYGIVRWTKRVIYMCVKLIRPAHTNQKWHQKVSDQAEAKGKMRNAWGSIKGCWARQQLKSKWSCLEYHQNVSLRENIFSLPLVFSLRILWKISDISWRTYVWLPFGFHYYILFAFSDTWSWKQNFSWLKSERLNKGESWLLLLCFALFCFAYKFLTINAFEELHPVSGAQQTMFVGVGTRNSPQICA